MSYAKPIWNEVTACIYNSSKSFGAKDTSEMKTYVGSSSSNSHLLGEVVTTRRFKEHEKYGSVCIFRQSIDGVVLNEMIFQDNNGRAGKMMKKRTALGRIKGL